MTQKILYKILLIPGILLAFTFHEFAHAWVADKLGDKTPKFQGRLTLNPIAHIDPMGFLMILLIGFGWAKPVETNPSSYKHYYKDDLKVSIAGVIANLMLAIVFSIISALLFKIPNNNSIIEIILIISLRTVDINCMLFFFNLMPLPGLDGFHILRDLFPKFFYEKAEIMYRYQMIILIVFIVFLAKYLVGVPTDMLTNTLLRFAMLIVK